MLGLICITFLTQGHWWLLIVDAEPFPVPWRCSWDQSIVHCKMQHCYDAISRHFRCQTIVCTPYGTVLWTSTDFKLCVYWRNFRCFSQTSSLVSYCLAVDTRHWVQRRNDGGQGAQFPGRQITMGVPNDCGGRRKVPRISQVLSPMQYICFGRPQVRIWGRPTCFLPGRHLTSLRPWLGQKVNAQAT